MGKRILVAVILAPLFFVVLFFLEPVWLAVLVSILSGFSMVLARISNARLAERSG